jgi:hypothetical protein
MSKKMASILLAYGIALAALSLLIQQIAPAYAKLIGIIGIAGGGLSVLWGIVALTRHKRRAWAVLTMIPLTFLTLSQTIRGWVASISLTGQLVLTLMFVMTVGMLMYLLHGERAPEFYSTGTTRRDNSPSRANEAHSNGGRRQSK